MKRLALALCAASLAACSPLASQNPMLPSTAALQRTAALPPHAPSLAATHGAMVGSYPANARIEIYVRLQGRHEDQLDALIAELNAPGSARYGRYLTPQQFGSYFGADPLVYARAIASLRRAGFTIEKLSINRTDIIAIAPASTVAMYFSTPIDLRRERGRTFFANRFEPVVPRELQVEAIGGLDDYVVFHPHSVRRPNAIVDGHFSWSPNDIAAGYDLNPLYQMKTPLDGKGVTIANATCGAASASDLLSFKEEFGLSGGQLVTVGAGAAPSPKCGPYGNGESSLDVDSALGVAREATFEQVVSKGPSNAAFNRAYEYIVNDLGKTVHVVTTSWGDCEQVVKGTKSLTIDEGLFKQAAAEGQAWFAASGDFGTDDCFNGTHQISVDYPGSSKYVTDVGGTNVKAKIVGGNVKSWLAESTWQFKNSDGASGGGKSILFAKPSYQKGTTPADGVRDVPDVALLADGANDGMFVYDGDLQWGWGGTSEAAPQWAALLAIVVQRYGGKAVQNPHARLYQLAATRAYHTLFHDITTGTNAVPAGVDPYGSFPGYTAQRGYDLTTGLGSFDGAKLVQAY